MAYFDIVKSIVKHHEKARCGDAYLVLDIPTENILVILVADGVGEVLVIGKRVIFSNSPIILASISLSNAKLSFVSGIFYAIFLIFAP